MSASRQDIEDFNDVFSEMVRLQNLLNESPQAYTSDFARPIDMLGATLNAPKDIFEKDKDSRRFQLHLSLKAQNKIRDIAVRHIDANKLRGFVSLGEFYGDVRDAIYIHIRRGKSFDDKGCSQIVALAIKRSKFKMKKKRYFFPFNIPGMEGRCAFDIGSVSIYEKDAILSKVRKENKEVILGGDVNFYNAFVSFEISDCSDKISYERALNISSFIFGLIQVFTYAYKLPSPHITLGCNPRSNTTKHYVWFTEKSGYYLSSSWKLPIEFDVFWNNLVEDLDSECGLVIKKLVDYAISPINSECLADRLIDSITWFGDATRDDNHHAQVVKLVTSMERLVTFSDEKKDAHITKKFCDRVSSLIAIYYGDVNGWMENARQIYKLRSELVHGSMAIHKSYRSSLNFNSFEMVSHVIFSACIGFSKIGLQTTKYEKQLEEMYKAIKECCLEKENLV
ncbi:MAG: HEPN domain-containing protein [Thiothrix sp.]|uniref:HEPN domain-containing protein n=1 Tax=Thiothrix sp. TaxID=1032 RepID=UPI00261CE7BC|nr:HEPN domain-containing protein [Thiothrix sp.]MDD5391523.1 HEPN domain-containing protein [Thiothrix sp.]